MAVRTILYKVLIGHKQPRQHAVRYWTAVRRNLGGDIGLKDMIIQVRGTSCLALRMRCSQCWRSDHQLWQMPETS
jgi:hypothetical protein